MCLCGWRVTWACMQFGAQSTSIAFYRVFANLFFLNLNDIWMVFFYHHSSKNLSSSHSIQNGLSHQAKISPCIFFSSIGIVEAIYGWSNLSWVRRGKTTDDPSRFWAFFFGLIGSMPLQIYWFKKTPLLLMISATCHWNFRKIGTMPLRHVFCQKSPLTPTACGT